ncbi:protein transporter YIF1 [Sporobolomyces salmoneus]|uniref:protein transporter YIF1 n=1 Tax=Sporobolomyces salmoneus TaxID=183962 RepID=UPI00316C1F3C
MYGHSARSPPPLQHPRPQHPVRQIPSASPPPPESWNSSSEYQRFASPPVNYHPSGSATQQLHPNQQQPQYGYNQQRGGTTPDAYIPQNQNQHSYGGGSNENVQWMTPDQSAYNNVPQTMPKSSGGGGGGGPRTMQQQQQQQGASNGFANFGQSMGMGSMMNDATAQMGMQFGSHALSAGQAYLDKNFTRLLPLAHLKHSFNVSNRYVVNKLRLLLWPWRHRPWSRGVVRSETTGVAEGWKPPREDVNCPDLYIPVMALVTYVLISAVTAGKAGTFDPSMLGQTASKAFGLLLLEFVCIKLGCYLLGIGEEGTMVDLLAYEGYKFVGVIVTLLAGLLGVTGWSYWAVFTYVVLANFFFQLRSLRHLILPDPSASPLDHSASSSNMHSTTPSHGQRARRIQFLFVIAAAQAGSMGFLVNV